MNQQELDTNIRILEHLGWFVAEVELEGDDQGLPFDAVLQCCRPDGSLLEEVPVNGFLLSLYDEEDGSLEARLWFFAPKYSTSLDNLESLMRGGTYSPMYEYTIRREYYLDTWLYDAEVLWLGFDDYGDCFENSTGHAESEISASMALAEAYLKCVGVL